MKPNGAILAFTRQRNNDLMRAFRSLIRDVPVIRTREIAAKVVALPAERFYVSEERAAIVISALLAGKPLPPNMRPSKVRMFSEIHRRVLCLRAKRPSLSVAALVAEVVHSPAPEFYMMPRAALDIIYKVKNGFFNEYIKKSDALRQAYLERK